MRKPKHLTIDEKRDWLASVFRDANGEYSQADKFKALIEDTRLAELQEEKNARDEKAPNAAPLHLLDYLPPAREEQPATK